MAPMYYRGAHAAILVFDVTAADTLEKVGGWVEGIQIHRSSHRFKRVYILADIFY